LIPAKFCKVITTMDGSSMLQQIQDGGQQLGTHFQLTFESLARTLRFVATGKLICLLFQID